jgi:hypothetical protein
VFFSSRSRFCSCSCVFFWRGYCLAAFQVGCRSDFCHDYGGVIIDFFLEDEQYLLWMPLNRLVYFITKRLDNYFGFTFTYKTIKIIKPYLWF